MRTFLILFLAPLGLFAQPGPPSFCFALAKDRSALRPLTGDAHVVQHYRERVPYVGWSGSWLKPEGTLLLRSGPFFRDTTESWLLFHPLESMAESFLVISIGRDIMYIDLPEDQTFLWQQAMRRSSRDTPEVIRFRPGRYIMEQLIVDPRAVRAAQVLCERLVKEERSEYERLLREQEALQRAQDRQKAAPPREPPPAPTAEEIEREIAGRPGLRSVTIDRVSSDTVWVRITGHVMLDGGCTSNMPLFGIEMLAESGWVERHALDPTQMACGMATADRRDHKVMLHPLRWWVGVNSPVGRCDLLPGTYRLVLMGANMKHMRTKAFTLP